MKKMVCVLMAVLMFITPLSVNAATPRALSIVPNIIYK